MYQSVMTRVLLTIILISVSQYSPVMTEIGETSVGAENW